MQSRKSVNLLILHGEAELRIFSRDSLTVRSGFSSRGRGGVFFPRVERSLERAMSSADCGMVNADCGIVNTDCGLVKTDFENDGKD